MTFSNCYQDQCALSEHSAFCMSLLRAHSLSRRRWVSSWMLFFRQPIIWTESVISRKNGWWTCSWSVCLCQAEAMTCQRETSEKRKDCGSRLVGGLLLMIVVVNNNVMATKLKRCVEAKMTSSLSHRWQQSTETLYRSVCLSEKVCAIALQTI